MLQNQVYYFDNMLQNQVVVQRIMPQNQGYARVVLRDGNYVEPSPEPDQPELVPF
jgi:hypothetical protein